MSEDAFGEITDDRNDGLSISEITRGIIADLTARDLKGQREYGTTMDRADLTPLEWLDHEYAELLDAAQYNRAARRQVEAMQTRIDALLETLKLRDNDAKAVCNGVCRIANDYRKERDEAWDEVRRLKGEEVAG